MLVIKWASSLKKATAHAHINMSLCPYIDDMLCPLIGASGSCAVYNKRETDYHFCTIFKFNAHAQQ